MIDAEKRIVVFGDEDVKIGCTTSGIMFGKADVLDNEENIEESYEFGIAMTSIEIVDFHKQLSELKNKEDLTLEIYGTTIKFKTKADLELFSKHVLGWGAAVVNDARVLAEYIKNIIEEDNINE